MGYYCSLPNPGTAGEPKFLISDDRALIDRWVAAENRPGFGVYYTPNPLRPGARRHGKDSIDTITDIFIDIDLRHIEESAGEAEQRLRNLLVPLSRLVSSGHGFHSSWHLKEPIAHGSPDYDAACELQRRLIDYLGGDPQVRPWSLLRLPGTLNSKEEPYVPCEAIAQGTSVDISELEEMLEIVAGTTLLTRKPMPEGNGHDHAEGEPRTAPVDIDQRLADMRYKGAGDSCINITQRDCMASLLRRDVALNEAATIILDATRRCVAGNPKTSHWNWHEEERDILWSGVCLINKDPTLVDRLPDNLRLRFQELDAAGRRPSIRRNKFGLFVGAARGPSDDPNSKKEIVRRLLLRGTTVAEVMAATGWPSVSMPAQARACELKLLKEKGEDGVTRYRGVPHGGADTSAGEDTGGARSHAEHPKHTAIDAAPFKPFDPAQLAAREWLYGGHYQRAILTATIGTGGGGKSSLGLVELVAMCTARNLLGEQPLVRCKAWYHNAEETITELYRRIAAICQHYSIPQAELEGWLCVTSGIEMPIKIATARSGKLVIDAATTEAVIRTITAREIGVACFDPLIAHHNGVENATGDMDQILREFARIAYVTDCSTEIVHHTRKPAAGQEELNVYDSRGAGAIKDAVRSMRVLNIMSKAEADRVGIDDVDRLLHFRIDRGKANMVPPTAARWRKFIGVDIPNGDNVGVVTEWTYPTEAALDIPDAICVQIQLEVGKKEYRSAAQSPDWIGKLVARLFRFDLNTKQGKGAVSRHLEVLYNKNVITLAEGSTGRHKVNIVVAGAWRPMA
jgi:hypothetical protein